MGRARQTSSAQATRLHPAISAVFLHHDVRCDLGSTEKGMLRTVNSEVLRNPIREIRIVVVPAAGEFSQPDFVRCIAVDFIGGHMDEHGFRGKPPGRFQEIESAKSINIKVIKWSRRGSAVARLRGGLYY